MQIEKIEILNNKAIVIWSNQYLSIFTQESEENNEWEYSDGDPTESVNNEIKNAIKSKLKESNKNV
jgi:hypothetical protein